MSSAPANSDGFPPASPDDDLIVPAPPGLNRAELFDHIAREHDGFAFTPAEAPKLATLQQRLGPLGGQRVLEPGCGAGHLTEHLAAWTGPTGRVLAFDPSAAMIARTRSRTAAHAQVATACAALETIELPVGAFDCVVCFRVWPHFDNGDLALGCLARWLRPAGRLLIVHWAGREELAAIHATHGSVAADVFPARQQLADAMQRHGFSVRVWIDTTEEIFIEAIAAAGGDG